MITILPAAETNCVSDMKTKAEFEAAMKDLKREMVSNMEQLRELKKMFDGYFISFKSGFPKIH